MTLLVVAVTGLVVTVLDHVVRRRSSRGPGVLLALHGVLAAAALGFLALGPSAPGPATDGSLPSMFAGGFTALALVHGWEVLRRRPGRPAQPSGGDAARTPPGGEGA